MAAARILRARGSGEMVKVADLVAATGLTDGEIADRLNEGVDVRLFRPSLIRRWRDGLGAPDPEVRSALVALSRRCARLLARVS